VDLKKLIAYSSISHMAYVIVGLFSMVEEGLVGAIFLMLAHGLVSAGLFAMVGILYDRYGTRLLRYYGGLAQSMPLFAIFFFFFLLANFAFPGTSNFLAELSILLAVAQVNWLALVLSIAGLFFTAASSVWLFNRLCFGPMTNQFSTVAELNSREIILLLVLLVPVFYLGLGFVKLGNLAFPVFVHLWGKFTWLHLFLFWFHFLAWRVSVAF
jgi:NADH:ubiquinone oxidoreductase subunit 4 (subunit M)